MRLAQASTFFDRTVCADAYDGTATFLAQLDLFDDSKRDGTTVARRVLSCGSSVVLPARRAITAHGDVFVMGGDHKDSFGGSVVRVKSVIQKADGLANVRTADQALRTLAGLDLYAARAWIKDLKGVETTSHTAPFFAVFASPSEAVAVGSFLSLVGRWHLVTNAYIGEAGFLTLEVDELTDDCLGTCDYTTAGAYDPASDTKGATTATVPVLWHRWQDDYFYERMSAVDFARGDIVARVSKVSVAAAKTGDAYVKAGEAFRVIAVRDDGAGAWLLHSRHA